jgi:intraflagellar transport protein 46
MEATLKQVAFPDERVSLSTNNYSKLVCNMLDIPIHDSTNSKKGIIEGLHVLFTVYSEFKENQHFQGNGKKDNENVMKFY